MTPQEQIAAIDAELLQTESHLDGLRRRRRELRATILNDEKGLRAKLRKEIIDRISETFVMVPRKQFIHGMATLTKTTNDESASVGVQARHGAAQQLIRTYKKEAKGVRKNERLQQHTGSTETQRGNGEKGQGAVV